MSDLVCSKTFSVMGGEFQFSCFPQNFFTREEVYTFFDEAYLEVKRIEEKFTDFKPSPFNRINDEAGVNPVEVDEETLYLLREAWRVSEISSGVFDISFASVGHHWRTSRDRGEALDKSLIKEKLQHINYRLIQIDEKKKTVFLPHRDMRIGLGGIGKGYAVDQVYNLFIKKGLYNFYINGSGDIRVHSRPDAPRPWRIGIRNPLSDDAFKSVGIIQLATGAIASSGGYIHNVNGDRFDNHIINPLTGESSKEVIASTVIADNAILADTYATVLMNLSKTHAISFLNDLNLSGFIFCPDGRSYLSDKAIKNFGMPLKAK